jgi:hypothetical protein
MARAPHPECTYPDCRFPSDCDKPLSPLDQVVLFMVALAANAFSAFSGGGAGFIQLPP